MNHNTRGNATARPLEGAIISGATGNFYLLPAATNARVIDPDPSETV
jgi:hypothetical protein